MKIIFSRQGLCDAVAPLLCAVSNKSTLAAVEGILIDAKKDNTCVLTSYDLEKGMRRTIQADVKEEGFYIINAQKLYQTLRVMEGETVSIEINENLTATITSGKASHKMAALKGEDFPEILNLDCDQGFEIQQSILKRMMSKVMYAMGVNDQRPVLNGCYFNIKGNHLTMVSCDSFKLVKAEAETDIPTNDQKETEMKFIVPTRTMNELYKLISDSDEYVDIHMNRKNIVIKIDDITFFSRLIDGDYIDYERIIIKNHRIKVKVGRTVLLSALERAALITEERITGSVRSHVKLEFENGILKISAVSAAGSTYDELEVDQSGENLAIGFNNRFLMDSIRACTANNLIINLSSPLTSINIEACFDDEDKKEKELFMILPVRMK